MHHTTKGTIMQAVRFHEVGGPEVLRTEDVDQPTPAAGQVRLRIAASAFNAADDGMRGGFLPIPVQLPHVPGYDVSGTVDALGEGVDGIAVGDAVIAFLPMERDGGAASTWSLRRTRSSRHDDHPAHRRRGAAVRGTHRLAGTVRRRAAAGRPARPGHGRRRRRRKYAIQLAVRAGVHVIATASPRSIDAVRAAGADEVVDHTTTDVREVVSEPVDVLLNLAPIDPEEFAALVPLVRDGGAVVSTTAFMATPSDESRGVRAATVFVLRNRERLAELVSLVDAGALTVEVTRRIPLAELPALHAEASEGRIAGKVVVTVA